MSQSAAVPQPELAITEREELTKRVLPLMTLGDGNSSKPATLPLPTATSEERAKQRFNVSGNAVVTGGLGTLGLEGAKALLQHGLSGLMLLDLNVPASQKALEELRNEFPLAKIEARTVDVTNEEAVANAIAETVEALGSVNILLCFAGIVGCMHSLETPIGQWRKVIDTNTTGSFICAQAVAKQMVKQGTGGAITFISSISAHRVLYPQPQAAYNVSKAALLMLKNCLAAEWARYGIRTNSISPGYMDTILNAGDGLAYARKVWAERNPSGRMGLPNELTGAMVLLSSDAGTYINGADIVVDGGGIVF